MRVIRIARGDQIRERQFVRIEVALKSRGVRVACSSFLLGHGSSFIHGEDCWLRTV
jgi:hypothetical protein